MIILPLINELKEILDDGEWGNLLPGERVEVINQLMELIEGERTSVLLIRLPEGILRRDQVVVAMIIQYAQVNGRPLEDMLIHLATLQQAIQLPPVHHTLLIHLTQRTHLVDLLQGETHTQLPYHLPQLYVRDESPPIAIVLAAQGGEL